MMNYFQKRTKSKKVNNTYNKKILSDEQKKEKAKSMRIRE